MNYIIIHKSRHRHTQDSKLQLDLTFYLRKCFPSHTLSTIWLQTLTLINAELPQNNSKRWSTLRAWWVRRRRASLAQAGLAAWWGAAFGGAGGSREGAPGWWERLAAHPLSLPLPVCLSQECRAPFSLAIPSLLILRLFTEEFFLSSQIGDLFCVPRSSF